MKTEDQLFDEWCRKENISDELKKVGSKELKDTLLFRWHVVSYHLSNLVSEICKNI